MAKRITHKHLRKAFMAGVLIVLVLFVALWFLVGAYQSRQSRSASASRTSLLRISHTPLTPSNIQSWMTFDYIDVVFKLPPTYLASALQENDPRYPNISIDQYAKRHNLNPTEVLTQVQQLVATVPAH